MPYQNGRLPADALAPIPGGRLRKDAARAWNAPGGPAAHGLMPTGSRSSYRTLAEQEQLYRELGPDWAADPGTSNHGWGVAIDLAEDWMWDWMEDHGAEYGWAKTEAFHEPWHWNYVGGVKLPGFETLRKGDRGKRVRRFSRRLCYVRPPGGRYLRVPRLKFNKGMRRAVVRFQRDHGLKADGAIGPKTARKLNEVFHRQWRRRHKRRPR